MSYKFSKEELRELLVDYNEISLEDHVLPKKIEIAKRLSVFIILDSTRIPTSFSIERYILT